MSARKLIQWNADRPIRYPWIGETNPYFILLSEFLLQQTRSDQALAYYLRMTDVFPTVESLADTPEDVLMKHWQGLGYYSRARNLHRTAKIIAADHNGQVPESYDELIKLPGIGPYTAAAISSFAFGESRAVVDGNVYRVLARYHGISTPVNAPAARAEFTAHAQKMLGRHDPAAFNQAIMNLGAQVCTPKNPACTDCPFHRDCLAYIENRQTEFPVKIRKKPSRDRYFHFIEIQYRNKTILQKRSDTDIWQGLYQFPLIERNSTRKIADRQLQSFIHEHFGLSSGQLESVSDATKQVLSHQNIHARFYKISTTEKPSLDMDNVTLVFRKNLNNFAFPRTVSWYLNTRNHDQ